MRRTSGPPTHGSRQTSAWRAPSAVARALFALALGSGVVACGDDGHAPVSPPPPGRDAALRPDLGGPPEEDMGVAPGDDMGVPPGDDMGVPPIEDMGVPPIEDMGVPPDEDMGGPMDSGPPDSGPPDAGPPTDASIGSIRRALLTHSCDPIDGRDTLLVELSDTAPGSCDPSAVPYLLFSLRGNLPVEAPETFTGDTLFGALCLPDGTCMSGDATLTFDSYVDLVSGGGSYTLIVGTSSYAGDFADATFCPTDLSPCGGS